MSDTPSPYLLGRRLECEVLDELLTCLRAHGSAVRVLRGAAGIGKSALLGHVTAQASGIRVVKVQGVEADMELAYASLHELCAPFTAAIDHLPEPQRAALRVAFGLAVGDAPDRFMVGLAALHLLTEGAESRPVLVVVDDAQWLDQVSRQTLEFVARRLLAEPVAMVFAVREPEGERMMLGLPQLWVRGLDGVAAGELVTAAVDGRLDHRVRDRLVAETQGNPLALLEFPRGRTAAELAYGLETAPFRSVTDRLEQDFARRLDTLPRQTRMLLLLAAAEPVGDPRLLSAAAGVLDIAVDAAPAQTGGLIEFGEAVRFRHPLVRSAVYRTAEPHDRRAAHRALSVVTDPVLEPDRRAWHAAQACVEPDEEVALALERSAERARQRGGLAAEAALLERAATLSPDPVSRGSRAVGAAEAHFSSAAPDRASELASLADRCPLSVHDRARVSRLRARVLFARSRSDEAAPLLLEAARQFDDVGSPLARATYLEAIGATVFAGRVHGPAGARAAALAALSTSRPTRTDEPADLLLEGVATLLARGHGEGLPVLRRALSPFAQESLVSREATMRWLLLAPVAHETFVHQLWDVAAWDILSTRAVRLAREAGALGVLPVALMFAAGLDLHRGEFTIASGRIDEANAISRATGFATLTYAELVLAAWRGDEPTTLRRIDEGRTAAAQRGEVSLIGVNGYARGVLYNGLARYDLALAGAAEGIEHDGYNFTGWSLAEHIEAAVRCGEGGLAAESLARLAERTRAAGTDWARGIQARSMALLSSGDEAERLYRKALEHLGRDQVTIQVARTHLLYGEWLRRSRKRALARTQLRLAVQLFEAMPAAGFAERARRELGATGEHLRRRNPAAAAELTPQEARIAELAAAGMTNPQIGVELFLSAHTVEWHLRKVYSKLGIGSRRELPTAVASAADREHGPRAQSEG